MRVTRTSCGGSIYTTDVGKGYRLPCLLSEDPCPSLTLRIPIPETGSAVGLPDAGGQEAMVDFQVSTASFTREGGCTTFCRDPVFPHSLTLWSIQLNQFRFVSAVTGECVKQQMLRVSNTLRTQ